MGKPVVVLTHSVPDGWPRDDAPFTFVTEGIEPAVAVASELAGDASCSNGRDVTHLRYCVRKG